MSKQITVIGGGFFGLYLSEFLAKKGCEVLLLEEEEELMTHASFHNQARVHNGYHYPRSVLTALRSRVSFPRFISEFPHCIDRDFEKFYLIARPLGKVTAKQFKQFCERIGAYIEPAPNKIVRLVNPKHIEAVFATQEFAFDALKLRQRMLERIADLTKIKMLLATQAKRIFKSGDRIIAEIQNQNGEIDYISSDHVFNCTYSHINWLLKNSGLSVIPLKHEMTEMCLVDVPDCLKHMGITVMCGPFFSVMPFPAVEKNNFPLHSFSHVRYTPHYEWTDKNEHVCDAYFRLKHDQKFSAWHLMKTDAARYLPILSECQYERSLWEVKTVLPRSETDDSRPILCKFNYGIKGLHCVMGGKIDNVYDAVSAIESQLEI